MSISSCLSLVLPSFPLISLQHTFRQTTSLRHPGQPGITTTLSSHLNTLDHLPSSQISDTCSTSPSLLRTERCFVLISFRLQPGPATACSLLQAHFIIKSPSLPPQQPPWTQVLALWVAFLSLLLPRSVIRGLTTSDQLTSLRRTGEQACHLHHQPPSLRPEGDRGRLHAGTFCPSPLGGVTACLRARLRRLSAFSRIASQYLLIFAWGRCFGYLPWTRFHDPQSFLRA